jgi:hypothetical protein
MGYQVGNIYVIAAVAVVGGALFGFDISSMSAIISTDPYLCYFNQGPLYMETDGKCSGPNPDVQGMFTDCDQVCGMLTSYQAVSRRQCLEDHGSVR